MLKRELINIINSGNAWAFIGSGISADAGCPDWKILVERIIITIETSKKNNILTDKNYNDSFTKKDYPNCFSIIETHIGRKELTNLIKQELNKYKTSGTLLKEIVSMPFKGFITTNYDILIEEELRQQGFLDWLTIGNINDEIKKVSGGIDKIIWHIHGSINLNDSESDLVLTQKDYDNKYLAANSDLFIQMRSLISQNRLVFLGFSFNDIEFRRLMKIIKDFTAVDRPYYTFLNCNIPDKDNIKKEFSDNYNIDLICYDVVGDSHVDLLEKIKNYGLFVLKRNIAYGSKKLEEKPFDPSVTGLLFYNELCLKNQNIISDDSMKYLLRSRIISLISNNDYYTIYSLIENIKNNSAFFKTPFKEQQIEDRIKSALFSLKNEKIINDIDTNNLDSIVNLTESGKISINEKSNKAFEILERFRTSLENRIKQTKIEEINIDNIVDVVIKFIDDSIDKRSLGVAMSIININEFQHYSIKSLLQYLIDYTEYLENEKESIVMSNLIMDLLSQPNESEKLYIGLKLQSRFAVQLLGFDENTYKSKLEEFKNSLFILDSHIIIPYLARNCNGYESNLDLINKLKELNSTLVTTSLLIDETIEHANWALKNIKESKDVFTSEILKTLMGKQGEKTNAFLEGFYQEISQGTIPSAFDEYLKDIFKTNNIKNLVNSNLVISLLESQNIIVKDLNNWVGFKDVDFAERDSFFEQIKKIREDHKSFIHDRQVLAEAESLLIIVKIRKGEYKFNNKKIKNSFFISNTRIINDVFNKVMFSNLIVTMRPESVYHWILSSLPCKDDEFKFLTNNLLRELAEFNIDILNLSKLKTIFKPLISASEKEYNEILQQHRDLIYQKYGEDPTKSFRETDDIYKPIYKGKIYKETLKQYKEILDEKEKELQTAKDMKDLSTQDQKILKRAKEKKAERERKARGKMSQKKKKKK